MPGPSLVPGEGKRRPILTEPTDAEFDEALCQHLAR